MKIVKGEVRNNTYDKVITRVRQNQLICPPSAYSYILRDVDSSLRIPNQNSEIVRALRQGRAVK